MAASLADQQPYGGDQDHTQGFVGPIQQHGVSESKVKDRRVVRRKGDPKTNGGREDEGITSAATPANSHGHKRPQMSPQDSDTDLYEPPRGSNDGAVGIPASRYSLRARDKISKPQTDQGLVKAVRSIREKATKTYGRRAKSIRKRSNANNWDWNEPSTLSEDEQIRQALEASVQSHNLGQGGTAGNESQGTLLPPGLELGDHSKRQSGQPVTLVAPFASIDIVASLLQAVYAADPARLAYLSYQPADRRPTDLTDYWKGVGPSSLMSLSDRGMDDMDHARRIAVDFTQRLQTLFAFMNLSERSGCLIRDVASLTPSNIVTMGAENAPPFRIAALYIDSLVTTFVEAVRLQAEMIFSPQARVTPDSVSLEQAQAQFINQMASIFQSSGATAYSRSPSDVGPTQDVNVESDPNGIPAPASVPVARNHINLVHDSVNADVTSCLRASLCSEGQGALLTEAASVLFMTVEHRSFNMGQGEQLEPFQVEDRIFLDPFMWSRRKGLSLDTESMDADLMEKLEKIKVLEARKRRLESGEIGNGNSKGSIEMLKSSSRYFEEMARGSQDPIRDALQAEAGPRLRRILEALEREIKGIDQSLERYRREVDEKRRSIKQAAKSEACRPEWQTLGYDLKAVLVHESRRIWAYVKQKRKSDSPRKEREEAWWKVSGTSSTPVEGAEVLGDKVSTASSGVFFLCYSKSVEMGEDEEEPCPEMIRGVIDEDNVMLESELMSMVRSTLASPSTSEMGTPLSDAGGAERREGGPPRISTTTDAWSTPTRSDTLMSELGHGDAGERQGGGRGGSEEEVLAKEKMESEDGSDRMAEDVVMS
ncbi:hypothetical protein IE53DRAFT_387247 [Violaceomyces palustris]|uniref:Uncharacterized protein n=1 Tax=Violaceomyces palustris TaxID=1673888 RepID=A0ACD0NXB1_9BASI|nr:hypothetical protein IE53DRAFT_387247 [Violaceomyces palustris]